MLQRNTFQRVSGRSRIWSGLFLIHHQTTARTFLHMQVEFLKAFGLSRKQLNLASTSFCVRRRVVWHECACASGRICLPSSTWMWSNAAWHVEGLMLWRRLAALLVLSELIRGRRRWIAAQKPQNLFFSSSCRLRQTLLICSASEFNEGNQNAKVFPFAAVTTDFSNQTIRLSSNRKNTAERR